MLRNYRYRHYTIIVMATTILITTLLPLNTPRFIEIIISFAYAIVLAHLGIGRKTEKPDELTELDLSKANKYTMIAAMLAILVFSTFGNDDTGKSIVTLPSTVYNVTFCGLIIFRSTAFLWFDRTVGKDEE